MTAWVDFACDFWNYVTRLLKQVSTEPGAALRTTLFIQLRRRRSGKVKKDRLIKQEVWQVVWKALRISQ